MAIMGMQQLFQVLVGMGLLGGTGMMIHAGYRIHNGDWSALPQGIGGAGLAGGGAAVLKYLSMAFGVPSIFNTMF